MSFCLAYYPISDSKSTVAMLKEHCAGFIVKELDAGHCPHDELPDEVNSIIREWIVNQRSKLPAVSFNICYKIHVDV
ncbi:hypothetical protein ACFX13_001827 [Malus domestica]